MRFCAGVVVVWGALARAGEPTTAIAPMTTGQSAPADLQRAFAEGLPRALGEAGFAVMPPNEVDMKILERPEFVQCHSGGCLAEEAAYLRVRQLALPRLERAVDGGFTVGVTLYDATQKRIAADAVDRVSGVAELTGKLDLMAQRLRADLSRPGRLEVQAQKGAVLTVDGRRRGVTPWAGELAAGDHVVALESNGARVERDVSVAPGATARIDVALALPAPLLPARQHRALRPLKWISLVGGVAGVAAGAVLLGVDGRNACIPKDGQRQCAQLFDTRLAGAATLAVGGALVITSVVLFRADRARR